MLKELRIYMHNAQVELESYSLQIKKETLGSKAVCYEEGPFLKKKVLEI